MNLFRWFLKRRFLTLAVLLALAVIPRGVPAAAQSAENYNDDGYFYVYTSIYMSGTSISAYASDPQPDFFETWGGYDVIGQPSWYLDGGSYSDSGEGYSFSSGPVPLGSTYSASFYFYLEYYGQAANSGEGPSECVPGQLGDGDTCNGYDYPTGYVSLYVPYPPPVISAVMPGSAYQGQQGTLTVNGSNFVNYSSEPLVLHLSGSGSPFTQTGSSSPCTTSCTASFSFDFTSYSPGTYNLWISNDESTSEPVKFTIYSGNGNGGPAAPPVDSCAVTSSPQVGFTSIVPTTNPGGSGTMGVSFSGTAFSAIAASVTYGPHSTPESIASNIAALISKNYYRQYGLGAKAFGSTIIYSGNTTLGTVNNATTGSSFGTDTSAAAGTAAENACHSAPPPPQSMYAVAYKAYIPVNNVTGPDTCSSPVTGVDGNLLYRGDGNQNSYRVTQATSLNFSASQASGYFSDTGTTENYGFGSPRNGFNLSAQDDDATYLDERTTPATGTADCYLRNAIGKASKDGWQMTTTVNPSGASVTMSGTGQNPLSLPFGSIKWNMTTQINTGSNTGFVIYSHTCYPAHEVIAANTSLYLYTPPSSDSIYIANCLTQIFSTPVTGALVVGTSPAKTIR